MYSIHIRKKTPGSKFFGCPDVWESFEWPTAKDKDGDEYDLDFVCQISCAEISAHDKDGLLPKTGMLYFFYDLDDHYLRNCTVLYYDGGLNELSSFILLDEDDKPMGRLAIPIDFVVADNAEDESGTDGIEDTFLLGAPSDPEQMGHGDGVPEGWQLLLEVDSYIGDYDFNFGGDCGKLCFFITKTDLAKRDFSGVWTEMAVY
jgi:uncharacterized protein YwqG